MNQFLLETGDVKDLIGFALSFLPILTIKCFIIILLIHIVELKCFARNRAHIINIAVKLLALHC